MDHSDPRLENVRKRRYTRYRPNPLSQAKVQVSLESAAFQPEATALVYEEAFGGCAIIVIWEHAPNIHDQWRVQVGQLNPMVSEVVWFKKLDDSTWKVGLKFLE
jgi:hypothetical protein